MKHKFQIEYEKELNPSQYEAVIHTKGPLLVIAGAGSGKTRTLTYRVARLVEEGTAPSSILLLTFTRKASQEMLKRATGLLDNRCERVSGGTFHSFANYILRRYHHRIGLDTGFNILDRDDSEALIGIIRKEKLNSPKQVSFPRKQTLANIFSKAVNKVLTVEDVVFDDYPHFSEERGTITAIHNAYEKRKREHSYLDYDDLLVYLKTLMEEHPDLQDSLSSSFEHIMVDEYQDTNKIQADIVSLLAGRIKNIMAVGDDSQSIYAFRGANFKNIMKFPELFPGTRIIALEENYRSDQPILDLTNIIIERAPEKYSKILFTRRTGGTKPLLVRASNENRQSAFIVEKIQDLVRNDVSLNEIAVLFRAGYHSFDLEIELTRNRIPFKKVGGFKFTESSHIKDILAHLKVLINSKDRLSWQRLLLLVDKIGQQTAKNIFEAILEENSGYSGIMTAKIQKSASAHLSRLKELFSKIDPGIMSVQEIGEAVVDYYLPVLREQFDDYPKREKDLEHLLSIMERYNSLTEFLTDMALEPPNTSIDDSLSDNAGGDDRLVLSTIHSAKGLEWHTVFVIWALDGRFPSSHSINNPEELAEELRLMYVAATRARRNLYFTYPKDVYDRSTGMILNRPSRFLDLIDTGILGKYSLDSYCYRF
ncbi:MAG: ATP-dependent helicase [Desulfobacteraceae bacterium]|nr:MAG: ATP-dependent helicase [Desulfobacteraceae bacterium]